MQITKKFYKIPKNLPASEAVEQTTICDVDIKQEKDDTLALRCAKKIADSLEMEVWSCGVIYTKDNPNTFWTKENREILKEHPVKKIIEDVIDDEIYKDVKNV